MTASLQPESKSPSRRALLAGALGGIGALAASAIGRPAVVRAGVDGDVVLGAINSATGTTEIQNLTNTNTVLFANSSAGTAVYGASSSGIGVDGASDSYIAVSGFTNATGQPAIIGRSGGSRTGVQGYSGSSGPPAAKAKTGVYGYAAQDSSAKGVWGETVSGIGVLGQATATSGGTPTGVSGSSNSTDGQGVFGSANALTGECYGVWGVSASSAGHGVHGHATAASGATFGVYGAASSPNGIGVLGTTFGGGTASRGVSGQTAAGHGIHGKATTTGFAGYFEGKVYTSKFIEMTEQSSNPAAPAANKARLFVRDDGTGHTQLCVRFNTGSVKVLATQT
jgi:hypothetical protein